MQDFSRPIPLAHYALLAVAVLGCFFLGIGGFPLFDLDEGAFSEATREMLASGHYLSTTLNGEPRYDKPILIYWLQAASVSLFGIKEFAFRLPSALAGSGWVIFTYLFVRRAANTRQALAAGIITASALAVSIIVKVATADALLNLLISASLFSAYLFLRFHERKYLYLAFAAMGLGFLTKGPVAVIIPGVVTFLYSALRKDLRGWLALALNGRGIALFFAIAAPWYVTQYLVEGDGFFRGFFLKHNVDRFSAPMESHGGNYFYYVPVLLLSVLPYTMVLLKTFAQWRRIIKDDLQLFLLLWFVTVFVLFSFSGTKLPHYLIYGYSGVFILMAAYLDELRSRFLAFLPLLLLLAALLFLPQLIEAAIPHINKPYYREMLAATRQSLSIWYYPFFAGFSMLTLYFMVEKRFALGAKLLASGVILATGFSLLLLPLFGGMQQGPVKEAALLARDRGYTVVMWGLNMPSFSVYSQRIVEKHDPRRGDIVITQTNRLAELRAYETLYSKNGIALIRISE
ncbi:glycosyl transferase family 39 [Sulfuricella sp. T08]|uniref:ArnT family glycosyltransferase n=1 Tax=Sulfuricella sp. T08 TaxID=1632857 RepID=UPI0006179C61|nr:glycosyltransferase family 39 protein [Sulfuricella sp. T08]GAO35489.1 glycosyl transferase family 39 [Sulfuricella sp. T08]